MREKERESEREGKNEPLPMTTIHPSVWGFITILSYSPSMGIQMDSSLCVCTYYIYIMYFLPHLIFGQRAKKLYEYYEAPPKEHRRKSRMFQCLKKNS